MIKYAIYLLKGYIKYYTMRNVSFNEHLLIKRYYCRVNFATYIQNLLFNVFKRCRN